MQPESLLTTCEVADELGIPVWLVRRLVDALGEEIPRAGQYRLVPRRLLGRIRAAAQTVCTQTDAAGH
jgi:hypothetical protein